MFKRCLLVTLVLMLALATSAQGQSWRLGKWSPGVHNVQNAIYWAFCGHHYKKCALGDEAWNVAGCETGYTYSVWSTNGQYRNIFQMGSWERRTYGWHDAGSSPWKAATAAYNYYTHVRWTRWECQP